MDLNEFDKVIAFTVKAHSGMIRKVRKTPYILHPMEVASIAGLITDDLEVIAAALMHDTVEDTHITLDDIEENFGKRVRDLVASETEDKMKSLPSEQTWEIRKRRSLEVLKNAEDIGVKVLWLSDKLSNMRSFAMEHELIGDALWEKLNMKDPAKHAWYYRTIADYTKEFKDHPAWREYNALLNKVFGEK